MNVNKGCWSFCWYWNTALWPNVWAVPWRLSLMEWIWVHFFFTAPLFRYGLEFSISQDCIFLWNFHPGLFKKALAGSQMPTQPLHLNCWWKDNQLLLLWIFLKRLIPIFLQPKQMQTAKCFSGHLPCEYMKWPKRFLCYPHRVLCLLCCPSPACVLLLLLLVCFPYLLHSRQVTLDLYFQVTFGDRLWEVCSRSTDTIAFIALPITLNFLTLFI